MLRIQTTLTRTRILLVTLMRIRILPFTLMRIWILTYKQMLKILKSAQIGSNSYILDCHKQIDADPDPAYHYDADPDPACHFDADPDPQHWSSVYDVTI